MRTIPIFILASLAVAAPALAQTSTAVRTLPVTGSVPQTCAMAEGKIAPGSLNNFAGLDGDTLRIIQFTDPATLQVRAASVTIRFDAVCNFPHEVRIESQNNGLWPIDQRVSDRPAGFAYAVPYSARVNWGPVDAHFDANAKVRSQNFQVVAVNDAVAGEFRLRIEIEDGASNVETRAPLVAGTYADTVRIFLEPR
jgi:spore coat protein U-like protein